MTISSDLPTSLSALFEPRLAHKIVGVAEKYAKEGEIPRAIPEHTHQGGPNSYSLTHYKFWTGGFFPGCLWTLVERSRLLPASIDITEETLIKLAQQWQGSQEELAYPAQDHDQGFRFCPTYGREMDMLDLPRDGKILMAAADGLLERFNPTVGCTRSWNGCRTSRDNYPPDQPQDHFLVIVDNMMNLNLLYLATKLSGNRKYAEAATRHAEVTMTAHIREDGGTCHVVDFDQETGKVRRRFAHQGWRDDSTWSRGQAWGVYGYAQCAEWTGREDFVKTSRKLADRFLSLLTEDGVPYWDFDHSRPTPRDVSAGVVTACGLIRLYRLLRDQEKDAAEEYLRRSIRLIHDIVKMSATPLATRNGAMDCDFGQDGWETLLKHSTINGHPHANRRNMDTGLVYADYYFLEYGNEAVKLMREDSGAKAVFESMYSS